MNIKGIIFDFDGVVCDSVNVKTEAFAAMYQSYGSEVVEKVVKYHLDNGGISRFEKFKYYHHHFLGIDLTEDQINSMGEQFSSIALQKVIDSPYIIGVVDFLKKYSKVAQLYNCTGTPETEIRVILEKKDLTQFFTLVYGAPKSKTEIIGIIEKETGNKPEELVFLGDAMTDYKAALASGVRFIGIESDHTEFPEGTETHKDFRTIHLI